MTCKTTKEHYEKWRDFVKERGLAITDLSTFHLKSVEDLQVKFQADPHLNNISLQIFDNIWISYKVYARPKLWALYEGACAYKHLLIYQILGCEPEFVEH